MKLLKLKPQTEMIDQFITELDTFPTSTLAPTVQYNTSKLINILREKEVLQVCQVPKSKLDAVNNIDLEFGKIVRDLVLNVNPEKSLQEYYVLEQKIEKQFSGDLYIYAKQAALSVKSLYYYKIKAWNKAIAITLECIALNDYLVQRGMHTLNIRVFEQNKNISRIHFRSGNSEAGYKLLHSLFDYMLNGENNQLYGSLFNHKNLWEQIPIIRETYTYEMFCMIVGDMIKFNLYNPVKYHPNKWYANLDFEVDNPNRQIIYNWIYINNQLHQGNYEDFFDSITYYFNQEISRYYDVLKMSLLVDVNKLISQSNYENKEYAKEKITFYIQHKLNTLDKLRNKIVGVSFGLPVSAKVVS